MNTSEELVYLKRLIDQHKRNIYQLEEMLAMYGADKPLHLVNGLNIERESLAKYEQRLEALMQSGDQGAALVTPADQITNLPRRSFFVGRLDEQNEIFASLKPESRTFLVGIEGLGGSGKSAIAIEVGYQCLEEGIFKAVIWISAKESVLRLNKIEQLMPDIKTIADIFLTIGEVLGFSTIGNLKFEEQRAQVYKLLARQPTLLIIDNLETLTAQEQSDILDFLRETPRSAKAIITSRERIPDGHTIRLHGLSVDDSISLLEWDARQKNIHLSSQQQKKLVEFTGGSPLAMLWVQGQVAVFGQSVDHVLDRTYLDVNTPLLKYCFSRSWELLQQTASRQILLTMALHVDPVSRNAIKVINDLSEDSCDESISNLMQLSLIYHQADKDYFGLFPSTRRFLRTYFPENRSFINATEWRMAQYYSGLVSSSSSFENWREYSQLLVDRNNILGSAQWCNKALRKNYSGTQKKLSAKTGKIARTLIDIGLKFGSVLWQRAFWQDRLILAHAALDAAKLLSDWRSVSTLSRNIAWIYFYQGETEHAAQWAKDSLESILKVDEPLSVAAAKRSLGTIQIRLKNFDKASDLLKEALETSSAYLGKDDYAYYSLGFSQNGMGDLEYEKSNYVEARRWYLKALETWRMPIRKDPVRHISYGLNGLGFVSLQEKNLDEAKKYFCESIEAAEQYGRLDELARAKTGLASVYLESNVEIKEGIALASEAIDIFKKQGMQHEITWSQNILGQLQTKNIS